MFGLTHGEFGRLYMFATLASALCIPFVGRLIDLVPAHRIVALVVPILTGQLSPQLSPYPLYF